MPPAAMDSSVVGPVQQQVLADAEHAEHGPRDGTERRADHRRGLVTVGKFGLYGPVVGSVEADLAAAGGPMTTATSQEGRTTAGAWVTGAFICWCLSFAGNGTGKDGTADRKVTGSAELGGHEA